MKKEKILIAAIIFNVVTLALLIYQAHQTNKWQARAVMWASEYQRLWHDCVKGK